MGKTVQVRNLDPEVEQCLRTRARERGLSLSEYLRRELARLADQVEWEQHWQPYAENLPELDPRDVVAWIRDERGPLP